MASRKVQARAKLVRDRVPEAPIALLAKEPAMEDRSLTLQDYRVDGEPVIPLFSSEAALRESTHGGDLGRPAVAIDRGLLVSLLRGDEVFLLDPRLPSELRFTALEFRRAFPGPRGGGSGGEAAAEPVVAPDRGTRRKRDARPPRRRGG